MITVTNTKREPDKFKEIFYGIFLLIATLGYGYLQKVDHKLIVDILGFVVENPVISFVYFIWILSLFCKLSLITARTISKRDKATVAMEALMQLMMVLFICNIKELQLDILFNQASSILISAMLLLYNFRIFLIIGKYTKE